ncbi:E3 ubiquitin-protein ligase TRIM38-like [Acipenser ruthenus]|uniref:E3 ubiquitin-protein ligase TRIM38-like n=1 Tax=Acipenser ruthenus TaxID=7906 RepID=UPI0027403EDC|nr:E3 ubiquitin-protein ligase TRIM38-like [Acipenser ruthenus]
MEDVWRCAECNPALFFLQSVKREVLKSEWKWILSSAVDSLTLNLDTAHPRLTLPVDGKQLRGKRQDYNSSQRFDYRRCVLGKECFTSGRHYWELGVGENTFWRLGVSRESAQRKGKFSITTQQGYWTVGWDGDEDKDEFIALTDPQTPHPLSLKPQKLGVYLDYEEGQLSFYNVETRSHIYTFTDMEFKPNKKLYPFFWTWDEKTDLALVSPGKMNDSSFFLLVWKWILAASVDVTLDPDTAQPQLILSAKGKRVREGETRQDIPDNPERFDRWCCVLGREGFTSGRRYWQVQVGGNTWWILGVSRESAERKGGISMTPQQGYWTVEWWSGGGFTALTDPQTPLPRSLKPLKLGVYLDYEERQLSFYNVETRSHIYTFTDMEFNPNEKLYSFFCTYSNIDLVLESPDPDPVSAAD